MNGKDKCKLLNDVRHRIAEKNNIEFDFEDCDFEGDCSGTCPKCESEVEYLERELEKKQRKGEKIDLEGIFTLKESESVYIKDEPIFEEFGMPSPFKRRTVGKLRYRPRKSEEDEFSYEDQYDDESSSECEYYTDEDEYIEIERTQGVILDKETIDHIEKD